MSSGKRQKTPDKEDLDKALDATMAERTAQDERASALDRAEAAALVAQQTADYAVNELKRIEAQQAADRADLAKHKAHTASEIKRLEGLIKEHNTHLSEAIDGALNALWAAVLLPALQLRFSESEANVLYSSLQESWTRFATAACTCAR